MQDENPILKKSDALCQPHLRVDDSPVETAAVFPELPSPLKNIYVRVKDLNCAGTGRADMAMGDMCEDCRPKPAVSVGVSLSF